MVLTAAPPRGLKTLGKLFGIRGVASAVTATAATTTNFRAIMISCCQPFQSFVVEKVTGSVPVCNGSDYADTFDYTYVSPAI